MTACLGSDSTGLPGPHADLALHYVLAPVEGGNCTLTDGNGQTLAGPVTTRSGFASVNVATRTGMALLICTGGNYVDEASGATMPGVTLRSYVDLERNYGVVVATPLTEVAFQLLNGRDPATFWPKVSAEVAASFGLEGIDLVSRVPDDIGGSALVDSASGRYGAMLATLSQMRLDAFSGKDPWAVIAELVASMSASGRFKDADARDAVGSTLARLPANPRLTARVVEAVDAVLRDIFENMQHRNVIATVDFVDTDASTTQAGEPGTTIPAGAPPDIWAVGSNFHLDLLAKLGGVACQLGDLKPAQNSELKSESDVLTINCPARTMGAAELLLLDGEETVWRSTLEVTDPALGFSAALATSKAASTAPTRLTGHVSAVAPTINLQSGGLIYTALRTFPVRGVVVELLDHDAGNGVLMTTSTDANGDYAFDGAASNKQVVVRAKAQIKQTRALCSNTGPQWNLAVRDNTSPQSPKAASGCPDLFRFWTCSTTPSSNYKRSIQTSPFPISTCTGAAPTAPPAAT
ncbi:MAG: hypothetical protein COW02_07775 [Comamonadaceae bacterium CG12_big_fil_rev_8_21_14_0_65_59_15]|nr:MAG: hypothetical protein COW02_07775 [Comamonadaceae bacterium CG12_big_fil_rev_8_21_14_0_65_59_15]